MDVEILLEKFMAARRGKWMLEPICKNANDKIIDFLIETAIDDFHDKPDKTDNSTAAIIENLGFSGKRSAAIFLNSLLGKEELKRYHAAARRGVQNFCAVTDFTPEDIEDLCISDFELSEQCEKNFEYEGSIITVSVTGELLVRITDEVGNEYEKFDFLNSRILTRYIQELSDAVDFLSARFCDAIVIGRRWAYGVFEQCILGHPLMRKFAENLMLGEYGESGRLKRIFYYFMGGFTDIKNQKVELFKDDKIGIVNSMDIDGRTLEEIKGKYSARLGQLSRGIYTPSEMEKGQPVVTRFHSYLIDFVRFSDSLSAKGYVQGTAENKNHRTLYRINAKLGLAAKIIYSVQSRLQKTTRISKVLFYPLTALKKKNGKYATDRVHALYCDRTDKYFFSDVLNDIYELL